MIECYFYQSNLGTVYLRSLNLMVQFVQQSFVQMLSQHLTTIPVLFLQKILGMKQQFLSHSTSIKGRWDKTLLCPVSSHCFKGFATSPKGIHSSAFLCIKSTDVYVPRLPKGKAFQEHIFLPQIYKPEDPPTRRSLANTEEEALCNKRWQMLTAVKKVNFLMLVRVLDWILVHAFKVALNFSLTLGFTVYHIFHKEKLSDANPSKISSLFVTIYWKLSIWNFTISIIPFPWRFQEWKEMRPSVQYRYS